MPTREQLANELDYGIRVKRPGTYEYAQESRKQLWPDLPSFLESTGVPILSDAASFAKLLKAEKDHKSGALQRALMLASILPLVPNLTAPKDLSLKIAHDAAMLPKSQGGLGLPAGNTAMDRAKAMGYNTETYHYSSAPDEFDSFSPQYSSDIQDLLGVHSGTKHAALDRYNDSESGFTMPLLIQVDKAEKAIPESSIPDNILETLGNDIDNIDLADFWTQHPTSLPYVNALEDKGSISYISPHKKVRSKFAAFNPLLKHSANILAAGVPATVLLNYLQSNKE